MTLLNEKLFNLLCCMKKVQKKTKSKARDEQKLYFNSNQGFEVYFY